MNGRERFGQLIRDARLARGMKSEELADRIGVSKSVMSYIETARTKSMPEPELLDRLHDALGLDKRRMLETLGYLEPDRPTPAGDVLILRRDDPRAEVLAMMENMPAEGITRWVRAFRALFGDGTEEREREELMDSKHVQPDTA